jgi:hypothetical protein
MYRSIRLLTILGVLLLSSATKATTTYTEPQTRSNPVVATPEGAKAQLHSGGVGYVYELDLPPAAGITPQLQLSYSSLTGSSEYGRGWSLSLSKIERSTRTGVPDYTSPTSTADGADRFELDGALLVQDPDNAHRFHLEQTDHRRILYHAATDSWEVSNPDGTRFLYGSRVGANSTLDNTGRQPDLPLGTFETFDHKVDNNDPPTFETYNMNNHPLQIRYSYHVEESGGRHRRIVDFEWEGRGNGVNGDEDSNDDRPTSYRSGFKIQISQRLANIIVGTDTGGGAVDQIRRYEFFYSQKPNASDPASLSSPVHSQLIAIQRYGSDDVAFPSRTDFTYTPAVRGADPSVTGQQPVQWKYSQDARITLNQNIDCAPGYPTYDNVNPFEAVGMNRRSDSYFGYDRSPISGLRDVNGDGFVDFVYCAYEDNKEWCNWMVALGPVEEGGSFDGEATDWGFAEPTYGLVSLPGKGSVFTYKYCQNEWHVIKEEERTVEDAVDMDGDGLLDVVYVDGPSWLVYFGNGGADGWDNADGPIATSVRDHFIDEDCHGSASDFIEIESTLVDVNGDGRPDYVSGYNGGKEFDEDGVHNDRNLVWVHINNGAGFDPAVVMPMADWIFNDGANYLGWKEQSNISGLVST